MKKLFITGSMAVLSMLTHGQSIDEILGQIELKNQRIQVAKKELEAAKEMLQTDLTLDDPVLEADYMIGRPIDGGNQFDFTAVQAFEFPTVYSKRKDVSSHSLAMHEQEYEHIRQAVLLQAKLLIVEGIHLNRKQQVLESREAISKKNVENYQSRHEAGEIPLLDLNKAKIQLLELSGQKRKVESDIRINLNHLSELNAGNEVELGINEYASNLDLPEFELLADSLEMADPMLIALQKQVDMRQSKIDLAKAMSLPKFEAGYHYQSVLGQTFNGGHFGMSIPLWNNRNKVKASIANKTVAEAEITSHMNEHHHHINQMYETYKNLKVSLKDYETVLNSSSNEELLQELLKSGEIDFLTYANEIEYFYNAEDQMLEIELELHQTVAKLLKYKL